tara:strand:- start:11235 stop:12515 length:1281 start_codon:yes stop_codon:yes gene_type:complete
VIERGDKISSSLETYLVGGSVRDELLHLPAKDYDYVVVGSTPEEMEKLGYRSVGKDFPVYLHPKSHDEYALARTERKVAHGYRGFKIHAAPQVTLEEDLARRDLTINAIARDKNGKIIDPFNGIEDLKAGLLRHVSPAFSEDPVRVLRTARFSARFGFRVAPETLKLMSDMVSNGEIDYLVPERVWQEISRGLMENKPSRLFSVLRDCGALAQVMPEMEVLFGIPQLEKWHPEIDTGEHIMQVIDYAATKNYSLSVRFALLTHDLGKGVTPKNLWPSHSGHEEHSVRLIKDLCGRIRVPKSSRDLAILVARFHGNVHRIAELDPITIVDILSAVDAYRKPKRFQEFIHACECDFHVRSGYIDKTYLQAEWLLEAFNVTNKVDCGAIAASLVRIVSDPARLSNSINIKIREARIEEVKDYVMRSSIS